MAEGKQQPLLAGQNSDENYTNMIKESSPTISSAITIDQMILIGIESDDTFSAGVAIGAGWQTTVAYMNVGSYFLFGIPLSLLLGYKFDMGVKGIWYGMVSGVSMQCCLLLVMVCRINWSKEVYIAGERIKRWGGEKIVDKEDEERSSSLVVIPSIW